MTEQMILDRMAQMIRVGFVNARLPEKMRVKVTLKDTTTSELITDWLPVLCSRASQDMQYDLPDIGDQVLCLFLSYGLEQGFVVGSMYGRQVPPVQSGDKWHRTFSDGTRLEYDRAEHKLRAYVKGDVELFATGSVIGQIQKDLSASVQGSLTAKSQGPAQIASESSLALDAPSMNMGGGGGSATSATMQGNFQLTQGDIIAEMVSLRNHVHICPACGAETSPPVGSGNTASGIVFGAGNKLENGNSGNENENEGGTGDAIPCKSGLELPPDWAAALAATGFTWKKSFDSGFEETKKRVFQQDNETFDTILCLPAIAEAEAKKNSGNDRLGWLYLKQMFEKWLAGKANKDPYASKEPFWISMDWVLSYFRAWIMWKYFTNLWFLFTDKSKALLFERIKNANLLTGKREFFKFIEYPWSQWKESYFQRDTVYATLSLPIDGLTAALGNFDFRALANGMVEPYKNGYWVAVEKVAVIVWDSFNFDGFQPYFYWSCPHDAFQLFDSDEAVYLFNSSFRNFQDKIKTGNDFLVLSRPKNIDTFTGYAYEVTL